MTEPANTREIFDEYGPLHLKNVDWTNPNERKSIAAALVEAVYILENDRQQNRNGSEALAPIWWKFFDFECIEKILDVSDNSIIGAIFENKDDNGPTPKYVIALRGTFLRPSTVIQDLFTDMKLALNSLNQSPRYQTSLAAVKSVITKVPPEKVWLAGHSLGAAVALQVGKSLARENCLIEAYLFNPPYVSIPIERVTNPSIRTAIRMVSSAITLGLFVINRANNETKTDTFTVLRTWIPYLFVNKNDPICCEYIGHFEHRGKMELLGLGALESVASRNSLVSLAFESYVGVNANSDSEALHLIPSANIVMNLNTEEDEFRIAHSIHQWWCPDTNWVTEKYRFM
ncbi:GDSL esterase/lipase At4g10955-like [Silene latifolia]|uniref:GDSL esterase/lipase At4g10955-like n=1 Tax=Silene latifolia TaxID=37657 RepID=UPI003D77FB25